MIRSKLKKQIKHKLLTKVVINALESKIKDVKLIKFTDLEMYKFPKIKSYHHLLSLKLLTKVGIMFMVIILSI